MMNITVPCESINYIIHKIKSYVDISQEKVNENILKSRTKSQFFIFKTPSYRNISGGLLLNVSDW